MLGLAAVGVQGYFQGLGGGSSPISAASIMSAAMAGSFLPSTACSHPAMFGGGGGPLQPSSKNYIFNDRTW